MESFFKDIVNIGIGVVESARTSFSDTVSKLDKIYEDLAEQGKSEDTEFAAKARDAAEQVSQRLEDIKKSSDEFFLKATDKLNDVVTNMKSLGDNPVISDLILKIENLSSSINQPKEKKEKKDKEETTDTE